LLVLGVSAAALFVSLPLGTLLLVPLVKALLPLLLLSPSSSSSVLLL